ncbi:anti-sigma factor RsbA family regulatory protein [Nonomuraea sp. MCN248]|uniref:Anti-sigma factor RsbA family regulatory protein n=1 Tax=Nonomuraea corallina TaxID=2989783 RepID=A0ABT4SIJ2_9ACTN|nr:anti-sigma factor RsbA family regulatory protein [Nonomuraea corallina]MDA0636810.1 anti-sigma factor RsbA family regulatory protein [Nonomuraea corallina]
MFAEPFTHPALFYRGDREYTAAVAGFVRDGLAAGEPVAVAVPAAKLELLRRELGPAADRVLMLDMTAEGRNPGRIIPAVLLDFADRHRDDRVRIVGEPIWPGRSDVEYPACAQHEALINVAFAGRALTILCPYDAEGLDAEVLREAELTHPVLRDADGERPSPRYAPHAVVEGHNRPLGEPAEHVALRFDRGDLAGARALAADAAAAMGFTGDRLDDIRLVVAELGANSLDHGGGAGLLRVWREGDRLVCEVGDTGHITDPLAGRRPVAPHIAGSRGLLIVNLLSDLVRIHTRAGTTVVRAYFDAPPAKG